MTTLEVLISTSSTQKVILKLVKKPLLRDLNPTEKSDASTMKANPTNANVLKTLMRKFYFDFRFSCINIC
jgi:hypothetical protein